MFVCLFIYCVSSSCSIVRSAGLFGSVVVQWEITPADDTTFSVTAATEQFVEGQNRLNFTVKVSILFDTYDEYVTWVLYIIT